MKTYLEYQVAILTAINQGFTGWAACLITLRDRDYPEATK